MESRPSGLTQGQRVKILTTQMPHREYALIVSSLGRRPEGIFTVSSCGEQRAILNSPSGHSVNVPKQFIRSC
jgi:hypothetical protein